MHMEANIDPILPGAGAPQPRWTRLPPVASGPGAFVANGSGAFADTLARAKRAAQAKRAQRAFATSHAAALDGPPPEVQRELVAAAGVWQALAAQGKELRFRRSADGRVSVELTDCSSRAVDVIGPSGLFRLLAQAR
jgi:hypothetical protein